MSSLKLQNLVNKKDYIAVKQLELSPKQKSMLKNYASKRRILSISSMLNNTPDYTKKSYKIKQSNVITTYNKYYKRYLKGNYEALGNSTKLLSFYFYSIIPKKNIIGNNLHLYKTQNFKEITKDDISEQVLKRFKKIRQWPHLTLMLFPTFNSGSCHDYNVLRAMHLESKNIEYRIEVSTGTNTFLSHIGLRITKQKQSESYKMLRFLILTLFHAFRTHQTLKYASKDPVLINKLETTVYNIVYSITQDDAESRNILQYIFTRKHNSLRKLSNI